MLTDLGLKARDPFAFDTPGGRKEHHSFTEEDILALEAALLSERPLLLRGEPGVGKSQLAQAAAAALARPFHHMVVDAHAEAQDLRWKEDLIGRLAQAQLVGALSGEAARKELKKLGLRHFVRPGPLWWGYDWAGAARHCEDVLGEAPPGMPTGRDPENGVVVLIDEIDKAESDLPNGLLEALGARSFKPPDCKKPVTMQRRPLVVITTNEERPLPAAFIRRCVVYHMRLPEGEQLVERLTERGAVHFPDQDPELLEQAAKMTVADREAARRQGMMPLPGQAEYIDLLTAIFSAGRLPTTDPFEAMELLKPYYLQKSMTAF